MLDSILGLLGNLLDLNFSALTDNIITLLLTVFAAALGFFAIHYLNRRRTTLDHERMAAIIKGLHYAGVTRDVFKKPTADSQEHLMRGLRWLFAGLGISGALYTYGSIEPVANAAQAAQGALIGVVPGAIGAAHLVCSRICRRRERAQEPFPSRAAYRRY